MGGPLTNLCPACRGGDRDGLGRAGLEARAGGPDAATGGDDGRRLWRPLQTGWGLLQDGRHGRDLEDRDAKSRIAVFPNVPCILDQMIEGLHSNNIPITQPNGHKAAKTRQEMMLAKCYV